MRALAAGASGYVSKNSPSDQLVAAISKVSRRGHYVSPALAEKLASALSSQSAIGGQDALSNRELEVLRLLASGRSTAEIADLLAINVKTVSTYKGRLFEKLSLNSIADLVRYAIDHDLDK